MGLRARGAYGACRVFQACSIGFFWRLLEAHLPNVASVLEP